MRRLRLNTALVLGALMALALLIALILPAVVNFGDYETIRTGADASGPTVQLKKEPLPPGTMGFPLGSDRVGRNLLPRVLVGIRLTLLIGLTVLTLRSVIAIPIGLFAGWRGGWWGKMVQSVALGGNALPVLILISIVLGTAERFDIVNDPKLKYIVFTASLTLLGIPRLADQVRSLVDNARSRPHVEAAVSLGATDWRLIRRHVLPIIRGDMIIALAAEMAWVLVAIGQLAVFHLHVGETQLVRLDERTFVVAEKRPELALMMSLSKDTLRNYWWLAVYPAITLGFIVACFQLLADGMRIRWLRRG